MTSPDKAYAAAVLAIYLTLLWPVLYILIKHGFRRLAWMGWLYLLIFCSLRIIGSALQLSNPQSTTAAILSSVGLSPLTIAAGGVLHEARAASVNGRAQEARHNREKTGLFLVLLFHIAVMTAIALLAAGAAGLNNVQNTAAAAAKDWHLAGGGAVLLVLVVAVLFASAVYTAASSYRRRRRPLVLAVAAACPFLLVRVVSSAVYFLGPHTAALNPVSGSWGVKIGVYLGPEVVAAVMLVCGGLVTKDMKDEEKCEL